MGVGARFSKFSVNPIPFQQDFEIFYFWKIANRFQYSRGLLQKRQRALPIRSNVGRLGIFWNRVSPSCAQQEQASAILRNAVICRVQNPIVFLYRIPRILKCSDNFLEKTLMFPDSQSLNVFEHEIFWTQFRDEPYKVVDKDISRIIECPFANQTKPLARSCSENYVNITFS